MKCSLQMNRLWSRLHSPWCIKVQCKETAAIALAKLYPAACQVCWHTGTRQAHCSCENRFSPMQWGGVNRRISRDWGLSLGQRGSPAQSVAGRRCGGVTWTPRLWCCMRSGTGGKQAAAGPQWWIWISEGSTQGGKCCAAATPEIVQSRGLTFQFKQKKICSSQNYQVGRDL